jgi:CheY-like chemotaxis protein
MSTLTILLVEDNAILADAYSEAFVSAGYEVHIVHDGTDAVPRAQEIHPSLVLLDLRLYAKGGEEVLAEMKENPLTKDIPVVIFTINQGDELKQRLLRLGAVDVFLKSDLGVTELVGRISKLISTTKTPSV